MPHTITDERRFANAEAISRLESEMEPGTRQEAERIALRWQAADDSRKPIELALDQAMRDYHRKRDYSRARRTQSKLRMATGYARVEDSTADTMQALFPDDDEFVRSIAIDETGDYVAAQINDWILQFALDVGGFWPEAERAVKASKMFPYGILKTGHRRIDGIADPIGVVTYVPPYQFWVESGIATIEDANEAFHLEWLDVHELRKIVMRTDDEPFDGVDMKVMDVLDHLQPSETVGHSHQVSTAAGVIGIKSPLHWASLLGRGFTEGLPKQDDIGHMPKIAVLWNWRRNAGFQILVEGKWLLWDNPDGFFDHGEIPFSRIVHSTDPEQFLGTGVLQAMGTSQAHVEDLHNIWLDGMKIGLAPNVFVNTRYGSNFGNTMEAIPGKVYKFNAPADMPVSNFMHVRDFAPRALGIGADAIQQVMQLTDDAVGNERSQTVLANQPESATGQHTMALRLSARLRHIAKSAGFAFRRVFRQITALHKQWLTPESVRLILGAHSRVKRQQFFQERPDAERYLTAWELRVALERIAENDNLSDEAKAERANFMLATAAQLNIEPGPSPFDGILDVKHRLAPALGISGIRQLALIQLANIVVQMSSVDPTVLRQLDVLKLLRAIANTVGEDFDNFRVADDVQQQRAAEDARVQTFNEALEEEAELLRGNKMPPPELGMDHELHLRLHDRLESDPATRARLALTTEQLEMVRAHMRHHEQLRQRQLRAARERQLVAQGV